MKVKSLGFNAILNIIKQVSAIVFPLLVFPYVSRVLGTTNYGKFSFTLSVVNYFLMLSKLGIATYAIREGARIKDKKEELNQLINELFSINVICTIISYVLFFYSLFFVEKFAEYRCLLLMQSLSIILTTIGSDWINQIYEDYLYITIRYIVCQLLAILVIFAFVKQSEDYYIYTFITVLASYGVNLLNLFYLRKRVKRRFTIAINWRKHIKPILILFSSIVAVEIYVNSDITMLGFLRNEDEVGIYSAISKIYNVAKRLFSAVTAVTIPRIVTYLSLNDKKKYKNLTKSIFRVLVLIGVPCSIGLSCLSKDIVLLVVGSEYLEGSESLAILCLAFTASLVSDFFVNAILITNRKEKYAFYSTFVAAIINIILNFFFIPKLGMKGAAIATLISEVYVMISSAYYSKGYFEFKFTSKHIVILIITNSIVFFTCFLCSFFNNLYIRLIFTIGISIFLYVLILSFCGFPIKETLKEFSNI